MRKHSSGEAVSSLRLQPSSGADIPRQATASGTELARRAQGAGLPVDTQESTCVIAVIVPTRNEQGNVAPLLQRLTAAFEGHRVTVVFVDDSDDQTPTVVRQEAGRSALDVRLLHREPGARTGGLGGAVLAGLRSVETEWAVVMDGDLQHPPELVPELVRAGEAAEADVVVASRHVSGGSTEGLSSGLRVLVSDGSTALSKLFFPRRLRGVSDPMSGFFALRPRSFDLDRMRPPGFKILLEMLARTPGLTVTELGFVFGERLSGESKASVREGLRFIRQLGTLSLSRLSLSRGHWFGRSIGFAAVGVTGLFVNMLATWLLADPATLAVNYVFAAIVATQISSTWNFFLIDRLVYPGPKRLTAKHRWAGFLGMSNLVLLARIPVLALLVAVLGVHYLVATGATLLAGFLVRFRSQERLTITEKTT